MKRILTIVAALAMTVTTFAQPQGQGPKGPDGRPERGPRFEQRDPAQVAQEQTDRLDQLVQLTPKQYKKIYKFNKRQSEQLQREMENMMPQGRPEGFPGGMGPGAGGRPERPIGQGRPDGMGPGGMGPGGMGPGGPGGRPRGDGQFRPGPRGGEMQELMEEQQAKRVKKYRRVLTPEQFQRWEAFEAEREFRQMIEKP